MIETSWFAITLEQAEDFAFRVKFDWPENTRGKMSPSMRLCCLA